MSEKKEILVYAHWSEFDSPSLMGILSSVALKGKETFSFEYNKEWLDSGLSYHIDPELQFYTGRFFPNEEKPNFGVFLDSCPDRWGRILMDRKEAVMARKEERTKKTLRESDYLLGVYDEHRMGALRFKLEEDGNFLNDNKKMAAPPSTSLRELEHASKKFEEDNETDDEYLEWINLLIAPGSSLGGARPKASIRDPHNNLWIAKFPSIKDKKDIGAWEMVANILAVKAGLKVAEGDIKKFNSDYSTYLTKRFDRTRDQKRIHFASAMTMLGYADGAGHDTGVSYLEIVEFLMKHGANPASDLRELWTRIVFNICIKNTDDHLRNHGFLLRAGGWELSPAYDINPNEDGVGLSLNISEYDNSLDIDLALSASNWFWVEINQAKEIISKIKESVKTWRMVSNEIGISRSEQDRMSSAFE